MSIEAMTEVTIKTSSRDFRAIANKLGITLEGNASYKVTKEKWIHEIKEAQKKLEEEKQPTELDILVGVTAYQYTTKKVDLFNYLLNKFGCSRKQLANLLTRMVTRTLTLRSFETGMEVSPKGSKLMSEILREHQIYICIIDNFIVDVLSYDDWSYRSIRNIHRTFSTNYKLHKIYATVHDGSVTIADSYSYTAFDPKVITQIVKHSENEIIQKAIKFWKRYHEYFQNELVVY